MLVLVFMLVLLCLCRLQLLLLLLSYCALWWGLGRAWSRNLLVWQDSVIKQAACVAGECDQVVWQDSVSTDQGSSRSHALKWDLAHDLDVAQCSDVTLA